MSSLNQAALDFLLTRRSHPQKTITGPYPDREQLEPILTAALRTPDHGKLEPWRLIVLEEAALRSLVPIVQECGEHLGKDEADITKAQMAYETSGLAVVVVESPVASPKVPLIEQTYSAGTVCLSLLNAALASGWAANWLSGWASHDPAFRQKAFGLAPQETVGGIIHIGTASLAPTDRPRPDLSEKVTWRSE